MNTQGTIESLRAELKELKLWKESALESMAKVPLQEIAKALDMTLGVDIGPEILPRINALKSERDEADRRAGAAERKLRGYAEDSFAREAWTDKAKEQWGVHRNVSFDDVWEEALKFRDRLVELKAAMDFDKVIRPAFVRAYTAGYKAGHHDTVEGAYIDVHHTEQDTYLAEYVDTLIAEGTLPVIPAEPTTQC